MVAQCSKCLREYRREDGTVFLRNGLEPWHLLIVALVVLLVFGSKRLPDTARSLGRSLRILKSETKAMRESPSAPETDQAP
ncbi:Sec-independent protein translocase subunit TatA [Streptomyces boncukensis]|uniref:Sec-independent protein translocase protein TatA n=1 Tax=Streptomyces boncukensis TaxID=2711219 RepID=A0A6G4X3Y6_9ACTN|nr:Sec-independent protein translocase subunit TatA [Streptomyces boncukensis]NGO71381.1 twin-arginine translocase TatA/TatE family subunit [Streptomyces boncukensis]